MSTATKILATSELLSLISKNFESLESQKDFRKELSLFIKSHKDYKEPIKKAHLEARKKDAKSILYTAMGRNKAFQTAKKLIDEKEIEPLNWLSDEDKPKFKDSQFNFAKASLKKACLFFTDAQNVKIDESGAVLPNEMILAFCRAATCKDKVFIDLKNAMEK